LPGTGDRANVARQQRWNAVERMLKARCGLGLGGKFKKKGKIMCHFLSFCVHKITDDDNALRVYAWMPDSHGGIERDSGLNPGELRECEWRDDDADSLVVRVEEGENEAAYKAAILAAYPTRAQFLEALPDIDINKRAAYKMKRGILNVERVGSDGAWEVCNYKDGERHGKNEWVGSDGAWEVKNYKDGKLHGKYERVGSDGAREACNYKDGKLHGKYEWVGSDGAREVKNYKDGKRQI